MAKLNGCDDDIKNSTAAALFLLLKSSASHGHWPLLVMKYPAPAISFGRLAACTLLLAAVGCAGIPVPGAQSSDAASGSSAEGLHEAHLSYRTATNLRDVTLATADTPNTEPGNIQTVGYAASEAEASAPPAGNSLLLVDYPHPNGNADKAVATLVVVRPSRDAQPANQGWRERMRRWSNRSLPGISADSRVAMAKQLTLSKQEVDQLIRSTASQQVGSAPADSSVALEVNGKPVSTAIDPASLRVLARQVAESGQVISSQHPAARQQLALLTDSGDGFYNALSTPPAGN